MVKILSWMRLDQDEQDDVDEIVLKSNEITDCVRKIKVPIAGPDAITELTIIITNMDEILKKQKSLINMRNKIQKKINSDN